MDISITNLRKYIFDLKKETEKKKRADDLVSTSMVITEKIDGTKLTLVRTNKESANYEENWIVSYKGTILTAGEFSHLSDPERADINKTSIGIGQYAQIFDHLKKTNPQIKLIPKETEFSIEFAQNKDTLTRTYENLGGLFLRSFATVEYRVIGGDLHTNPTSGEQTKPSQLQRMADLLDIKTFPILFTGRLTKEDISRFPEIEKNMGQVDWTNSLDIISKFSDAILKIPSVLGGKTEGVVMQLKDGRYFKIVQADQYDADGTRGEKKDLYRADPEAMSQYFQQIRALIKKVIQSQNLSGKSPAEAVAAVNKYVSANKESLKKFFDALTQLTGGKRTIPMIVDDIHDTVRLLVGKSEMHGRGSKSIGLLPIAGKPLHIGHWKLIEKASKENDAVVVFTSSADRVKAGEFPIKGEDFVKFWSDIFIPALPKNVRVKFVDSPIRSVIHELGWFEQTATQDAEDVPTVKLYSDSSDIESNFKDEDLKKFPTLLASNKIQKVGVDRTTTTNISGTKMREFLKNGDKESFLSHLPPVSNADKEHIWTTLNKSAGLSERNPYKAIAERVINEMFSELVEGGWRSTDTQNTVITPALVEKTLAVFDKFVAEFCQFSKAIQIKSRGPVGSAAHYKSDLNDPNVKYGDIDIQVVLPVSTNDRPEQLKANKLFQAELLRFIAEKSPSYLVDNRSDRDYAVSYLLFKIGSDVVQVDLVLSYTATEDWVASRVSTEKGLKGFVPGMLLSALGNALSVSLTSTTNPYIQDNGKKVYLNSSSVFSDVVRFYSAMAGEKAPNLSKLQGFEKLDPTDTSFKKKCLTVVAIANSLEDNHAFERKVVKSKDGTVFSSRKEFVDYISAAFKKSMEDAKTAKKLEKASTPDAIASIEKIKKDAERGTEMASELLKESGQSVASIDPKTPKTIEGVPAQAMSKLKIVDPSGKDIHSKVSADVKALVYVLNENVGFWKKNNPYIENGFIFNGSSQYLMDPAKFNVLSKYKSSFGDIDVIIPKVKLSDLANWLDTVDDNQPEWKPTPKNKLTSAFYYVGRTKSYHAIPDQLVTLWWYAPAKQVVQIDFEGDDMVLDKAGYEKPSEWTKFTKDSPWDDLEKGIKGLAGALLLRSLARGTTFLQDSVVLTATGVKKIEAGAKEITDKDVTKNVRHAMPSMYTLNTGGGLTGMRKAYKFIKALPLNGKIVNAYAEQDSKDTPEEDRLTNLDNIFKIFFGKEPSPEERSQFRSFQGILRSMKKYLSPEKTQKTMEKFRQNIESEHLSDSEKAAIQSAIDSILGAQYKIFG